MARERRKRQRLDPLRRSVQVRCRDTVWCQDAAHPGRTKGSTVEAEAVKGRMNLRHLALPVGAASTGDDVVQLLKKTEAEMTGLPLVWHVDNGSAYRAQAVEEYLEDERGVHLKGSAQTPKDKGAVENCMRELKEETGLGNGSVLLG